MDLNEADAAELREILSPYKAAGRKLTGRQIARRPRVESGNKDVRKWAEENGIGVNSRGRVSEEVLQQYEAAQN